MNQLCNSIHPSSGSARVKSVYLTSVLVASVKLVATDFSTVIPVQRLDVIGFVISHKPSRTHEWCDYREITTQTNVASPAERIKSPRFEPFRLLCSPSSLI